jgi:hypothetical protein
MLPGGEEIPFIKTTPDSKGIVGNCQFFVNQDIENPDWVVVVESLDKKLPVHVARENTIFVAMENESIKNYEQAFTDQFNWVVTCHQLMRHPRKIATQQAHFSHLFWARREEGQSLSDFQAQWKPYDELLPLTSADIPKTKLITAVASHKTRSPGQKLRNDFIRAAKAHFGDQMDAFSNRDDTFGPGTKVEKFKWNSLAPYEYYLAIDNSIAPHYWTSNIGDGWTAGCYPFYFGHEDIKEYFDPNAYTMIDINDVDGALATIDRVIAEHTREKRLAEIWEARRKYMREYNMFAMVAGVINSLPQSTREPELLTLAPEQGATFTTKQKLIKTVNKIPGIRNAAKIAYRTYRRARYGEKALFKNE